MRSIRLFSVLVLLALILFTGSAFGQTDTDSAYISRQVDQVQTWLADANAVKIAQFKAAVATGASPAAPVLQKLDRVIASAVFKDFLARVNDAVLRQLAGEKVASPELDLSAYAPAVTSYTYEVAPKPQPVPIDPTRRVCGSMGKGLFGACAGVRVTDGETWIERGLKFFGHTFESPFGSGQYFELIGVVD